MASILKFATNIPCDVTVAPKAGDYFGEKKTGEYGDQYMYRGLTVDGDVIFYATPLLHDILAAANVRPGERIRVTKLEKDWQIETAEGKYTKAVLSHGDAGKAPEPPGTDKLFGPQTTHQFSGGLSDKLPVPPAPTPTVSVFPPGFELQRSITPVPDRLSFEEVCCLAWMSHIASKRILDASGVGYTAAEVNSLCAQIFIRSEKEKCKPTEKDMGKFVKAMGGGSDDTIGPGGYEALKAIATKIGLPEQDLVERMGAIYMKEMKADRYPADPRQFPAKLIPEVEVYLDAVQKVGPLA